MSIKTKILHWLGGVTPEEAAEIASKMFHKRSIEAAVKLQQSNVAEDLLSPIAAEKLDKMLQEYISG